MKIKCIKNNIYKIRDDKVSFKNIGAIGYYDDGGELPLLDIGKYYNVYSLCILEKYPWFYICNERVNYLTRLPLPFFEIVDSRLSRYWHLSYNLCYTKKSKGDLNITIGFSEWISDKNFYEKLLGGNSKEEKIFGKYKELMDLEFPDNTLKNCAIFLKDKWVMCAECEDAWEVSDNNGVIKCPKCHILLNNPVYENAASTI